MESVRGVLDILGRRHTADLRRVRYLGLISFCFESVAGVQVGGIQTEEIGDGATRINLGTACVLLDCAQVIGPGATIWTDLNDGRGGLQCWWHDMFTGNQMKPEGQAFEELSFASTSW